MAILWQGVCKSVTYEYDTVVEAGPHGVWLEQYDERGQNKETVYMGRDEAIDIAFAILKDCAPTLAEALEGLRGPAAAGADATTATDFRQYGDSNFI